MVNKILKQYQHVDMVFGTHNIHRLPNILHDAYMSKELVVEVWSKEGDVIENLPKKRIGSIKAWVNIMYGYVARELQKAIIIGKGGSAIKKLGMLTRTDIEEFTDKKIFLELMVKIDKDWRDNKAELKRFGYEA